VIDFRYHVVSLISVFLALAVGIALGAGPLEETIGDSLTGQVEQLREDRDALRTELDDARSTVDRQAVYLDETAPLLLGGTLEGRRVAVVSLGAVEEDSRVGVEEKLAAAGATVSARVQVSDLWTDPTVRSFREALTGTLVTYLDPAPATGAGVDVELAEALVQGLTGADPADPGRLSENAGLLLELLSSGDSELITLLEPVEAPADAIVLLTGEAPETDGTTATETPAAQTEEAEEAVAGHVALVTAAQERSEGALLAGGVAVPGDLVSTVLEDADLASEISTVTGFRGVPGQVSVALGLNARIGGVVGHYGFGDGLTPVPEPVDLPPVDRSPDPVAPADAPDAPDPDAAPEG
jgi:Copper transport outer membrane protein, MctB